MKRVLLVLLCAVLVVGMAACGQGSEPEASASAEESEQGAAAEEGADKSEMNQGIFPQYTLKLESARFRTGDDGQLTVVLDYEFTNTSGEAMNASNLVGVRLLKNGVQTDHYSGMQDDELYENYVKTVTDGTSLPVRIIFEADSADSDFEILYSGYFEEGGWKDADPQPLRIEAEPEATPSPTPEPAVEGVKEKVGDYTFLMQMDAVRECSSNSGLYYLSYEDEMGSVSWAINDDAAYMDTANAEPAMISLLETLSANEANENFTYEEGLTVAGNPAAKFAYERTDEDGEVRYWEGIVFVDVQNTTGLYIFEAGAPEAIVGDVKEVYHTVIDSIRLEPDALDGDTALSSTALEDFSPEAFNTKFFNELIIINTMLGEDNGIVIPVATMDVQQKGDDPQVYKPGITLGTADIYYYTDTNGDVVAGFIAASTEYGVGYGGKTDVAAMSLAFAPLGEGETFTDRLQTIDDIPVDGTDPYSVGNPLEDDLTMISPSVIGNYNTYVLMKIGLDEETTGKVTSWAGTVWESLM